MSQRRPYQRILRFILCFVFLSSLNFSPALAQPITNGSPQMIENSIAGDPDTPGYFDRVWTIGTWHTEIGLTGLSMADYDRDGVKEILDAGKHRWKIISYSAAHQRYEVEYTSKYYMNASSTWDGIGCVAAADFGPEIGYRIFVTSVPNRLEVYDSASRRLIASAYFPLDTPSIFDNCIQMVIQDVDIDGTMEIIARSENNLVVMNASTYEEKWSISLPYYGNEGKDMAVGNTDGDPALEIVLNDRMIDGVTHQIEWQPVNLMGGSLITADIDGDGKDEVINSYGWLVAYDADTQLVKWIIHPPDYRNFEKVATGDTDGDGVLEIVAGSDSMGYIRGYDSATQTLEWQIDNPAQDTSSLVVGDSDGDGAVEVIWGSGKSTSSNYRLYFGDIVKKAIEWKTPNNGNYSTVYAGDVDADGQVEITASGCYMENGINGMPVIVFDEATKEAEWAGPFIAPDWEDFTCPSDSPLLLANIDKDPALEIIIPVVDKTGSGGLAAYDGKTYRLEWEWYLPPYKYYEFDQMAAEDVDGDGQIEIIASESGTGSGFSSPYVYIIDPSTSKVEWISPLLKENPSGGENAQIKICNLDGDPNPEIIANVYPLWVFDGKTHTQQWKKDGYNAIAIACGDLNQDGRDELIAAKSDATMEILDGQTGGLVHSYSLAPYNHMINTLQLVDLDQDGRQEILAEDESTLLVFSLENNTAALIWQSQPMGMFPSPWVMFMRSNPVAMDLDGDGLMEVLSGSTSSASLFRYNPEAAQNPPMSVSFITNRPLVIAPGSQLDYTASLTNQSGAARDFHVTIPLSAGSIVGNPVPTTGSAGVTSGTLGWTLSLAPFASGELRFTLAVPSNSADGSTFVISAHFGTSGSADIVRTSTTTIDASLPQSSIIQPAPYAVVYGSQAIISGTSADDHSVKKVEVSIDNGEWIEAVGTNPWTYTWSLPGDGMHHIRSRATDTAGNIEPPGPETLAYVSNQGPIIQATSPANGDSNVWEGQPISVQFNIPVQPETFSITCDPTITVTTPIQGNNSTLLTIPHSWFPLDQMVTCTITAVQSTQNHPLETPMAWSFMISPTANRIYLPTTRK